MKKIIEYLKKNEQISIRKMSNDLNIPLGSINVKAGTIPQKYLQVVKDYLISNYDYKEEEVSIPTHEDNIQSEGKQMKMYNVGRIPSFPDNRLRYQDHQGLWRRAEDWCMEKNGEGEKVLKRPWQAQTGEELNDVIGTYFMTNNGNKMYVAYA